MVLNSVHEPRYSCGMGTEVVRAKLEEVARLQRELPTMRAEAVAEARAEKMTWREIAAILDMTERGVIAADKKWRETE